MVERKYYSKHFGCAKWFSTNKKTQGGSAYLYKHTWLMGDIGKFLRGNQSHQTQGVVPPDSLSLLAFD